MTSLCKDMKYQTEYAFKKMSPETRLRQKCIGGHSSVLVRKSVLDSLR